MKLKYLTILIFLFSCNLLFSQQIYFCESYSQEGEPVNHKLNWQIEKDGENLFILLKEGSTPLEGPIIYMFVDKNENGQYFPFDSKAIKVNRRKDWLVYRYKFKQEGRYSIYFQDTEENEIAQKYVNITIKAEESDYRTVSEGSLYYEGSNMSFCEIVIDGRPINIRSVASLKVHGRVSYVFINNYRPLNTEKVLVQLWRRNPNSYEYDEFVESKKYRVKPDWDDTFFRYTFKAPGEYKMFVFNENELILANGFIKIVP